MPFLVFITSIVGCCKDKDMCKDTSFEVQPFFQTTTKYQCNGNDEYTYIFRDKQQVDSLSPNCFAVGPIPYQVDDNEFVYIIIGRMSYHYNDTIGYTRLTKDSCSKKLTYEVEMIQKDTALWSNGGGILPVYCSVENIPADYEVEVKYKYVPIQ